MQIEGSEFRSKYSRNSNCFSGDHSYAAEEGSGSKWEHRDPKSIDGDYHDDDDEDDDGFSSAESSPISIAASAPSSEDEDVGLGYSAEVRARFTLVS